MTEEEAKIYFQKIEHTETDYLKQIVLMECSDTPFFDTPCHRGRLPSVEDLNGSLINRFYSFLLGRKTKKQVAEEKAELIETVCNNAWEENINKIHSIIASNPKTSKCIMDIICLLAPAIAQQYTGFSGMAIVGTLTIMCKQNLGL